jgi:hypothetical protein
MSGDDRSAAALRRALARLPFITEFGVRGALKTQVLEELLLSL